MREQSERKVSRRYSLHYPSKSIFSLSRISFMFSGRHTGVRRVSNPESISYSGSGSMLLPVQYDVAYPYGVGGDAVLDMFTVELDNWVINTLLGYFITRYVQLSRDLFTFSVIPGSSPLLLAFLLLLGYWTSFHSGHRINIVYASSST